MAPGVRTKKRRPKKPQTVDQVVARQVRRVRDARGISQQALADALGEQQSTIARLELGDRQLTVGELFKIAAVLDVAPFYLLSGSFTGDDVPISPGVKLTPGETREWITGDRLLPGGDERHYFDIQIPDDVAAENRAVRTAFENFRRRFPRGVAVVVPADEAPPSGPKIELQWNDSNA